MSEPSVAQTPSQQRPWSLYVFIAWAFVLAFNTGLILWDFTRPLVNQYGFPATSIGRLALAIAFIAPFGFGASVFGLWHLRPWGRYLFLGMTILFFGFNLLSVWLPGDPISEVPPPKRWVDSARFGLALVIPLIYFNLNWIKPLFQKNRPVESEDS